jgi:hypothetical protein
MNLLSLPHILLLASITILLPLTSRSTAFTPSFPFSTTNLPRSQANNPKVHTYSIIILPLVSQPTTNPIAELSLRPTTSSIPPSPFVCNATQTTNPTTHQTSLSFNAHIANSTEVRENPKTTDDDRAVTVMWIAPLLWLGCWTLGMAFDRGCWGVLRA